MACAFSCFSSFCSVIVAIQFFAKVVPWFYENIIGPMILGPKITLRNYGDWACKYNEFVIHQIDLEHQSNGFILAANIKIGIHIFIRFEIKQNQH